MSQYVIDTIALARYLQDNLPKRADRVLREAEDGRNDVLIPQIVVAEYIYIAMKGRLKGSRATTPLREVIHNLLSSSMFTVSAMPNAAWEIMQDLPIPEMHDRMIAAESMARKIPLLTNDSNLKSVPGLRTIW